MPSPPLRNTLTATGRCSAVSVPRYTVALPPSPTTRSNRYRSASTDPTPTNGAADPTAAPAAAATSSVSGIVRSVGTDRSRCRRCARCRPVPALPRRPSRPDCVPSSRTPALPPVTVSVSPRPERPRAFALTILQKALSNPIHPSLTGIAATQTPFRDMTRDQTTSHTGGWPRQRFASDDPLDARASTTRPHPGARGKAPAPSGRSVSTTGRNACQAPPQITIDYAGLDMPGVR
jgi:hypothetical protein